MKTPEASGWSGSRRLLRRLRDIMAAPATAQERLDQVVKLIAANLVAEVCSIYLRRAGEVLELFATEGLKPEAVHRTRLHVGEGLIGEIAARARPLALADAQAHPDFVYKPETGEEIYHSLMGVPIMRGGRVIGVVAVQNRTRRQYAEEEVEALQIIAMVLAELAAGGELVPAEEMMPMDGIGILPLRLEGIVFNQGLAQGVAVIHERRITVEELIAEDPTAEQRRFREATAWMHDTLDDMFAASDLAHGGEHREVLETYRLIAQDRGWLSRIHEAIGSGLTAEAAVQRVQNETRVRIQQITDPFFRERLSDFEDLTNRLLQHLTGRTPTIEAKRLPGDAILFARSLGPAELLDYERTHLKALVLEEGSASSHVAIVARALDIPVVGRVGRVLDRLEPRDPVIVDGDHGQVFIRPGEEIRQTFAQSLKLRREREAAYAAMRDLPAETKDGVSISLLLNAGLLIELEHLSDTGADGIGLFRTEINFMARAEMPDVAAQAELYSQVLDMAGDKTVTFRTLDIGGDKRLPYFEEMVEENPALGWRAIRIGLDRPAVLRRQLRAMLRAGAGRSLRIMFPMIAEVAEFDAAQRMLDKEHTRAQRNGEPLPEAIAVGVMMEVPALYWQLPALLSRADFLSVGSNDLLQFLFASDRGNPRLAGRYDPLSPSMISFLRAVAGQCREKDVPLTLCGEIAGQPLEAMTAIGLGFRSLSMPASSIGPVKDMIRSVDMAALESYLGAADGQASHTLRGKLRAFARDHRVAVS